MATSSSPSGVIISTPGSGLPRTSRATCSMSTRSSRLPWPEKEPGRPAARISPVAGLAREQRDRCGVQRRRLGGSRDHHEGLRPGVLGQRLCAGIRDLSQGGGISRSDGGCGSAPLPGRDDGRRRPGSTVPVYRGLPAPPSRLCVRRRRRCHLVLERLGAMSPLGAFAGDVDLPVLLARILAALGRTDEARSSWTAPAHRRALGRKVVGDFREDGRCVARRRPGSGAR